jgi:hypothetical protein
MNNLYTSENERWGGRVPEDKRHGVRATNRSYVGKGGPWVRRGCGGDMAGARMGKEVCVVERNKHDGVRATNRSYVMNGVR